MPFCSTEKARFVSVPIAVLTVLAIVPQPLFTLPKNKYLNYDGKSYSQTVLVSTEIVEPCRAS
jgi:hypothetical protein